MPRAAFMVCGDLAVLGRGIGSRCERGDYGAVIMRHRD
jgi:hypothetical protein